MPQSRENLRRAIDAFGRALELDARFAPAWAGLADALHVESDHAESPARLEELQRRALFAAERAITLGPRLADGYRQRGILRRARCDWVGAQADLRRARQLGPDDAGTSREEGRLRAALGRLREAIRLLLKYPNLHMMTSAYAPKYLPQELIRRVTGAVPESRSYMKYLTDKYGEIYGL